VFKFGFADMRSGGIVGVGWLTIRVRGLISVSSLLRSIEAKFSIEGEAQIIRRATDSPGRFDIRHIVRVENDQMVSRPGERLGR